MDQRRQKPRIETDLSVRLLSISLSAEFAQQTKLLDTEMSTVLPGVMISLSKDRAETCRTLIWAESADNELVAADMASRLPGFTKTVDSPSEFLCQMRSGAYTTYVLLDKRKPHPEPADEEDGNCSEHDEDRECCASDRGSHGLIKRIDRELAEKVYAGATLIGDRWANRGHLKHTHVFGVATSGYLPSATYEIQTAETTYTPAT